MNYGRWGNMNIQIFGTKKCFDTKKAERYFKERGISYAPPLLVVYYRVKSFLNKIPITKPTIINTICINGTKKQVYHLIYAGLSCFSLYFSEEYIKSINHRA